MTCIVGLIDNGKVWMGGDSAGVSGHDVTVRKDTKVFKNGEFLIGYTSSFRMGQLLRFKFSPPRYYPEKYHGDEYEYMCTDFIDAVRDCLKAGGYSKISANEESGGTFLVGFKGRLFEIEGDFQVGESALSYNSVGCGQDYAKGSLHRSFIDLTSGHPKYVIENALEAAAYFSGGVRGPFVIESI
jgi:ATP-dependent protease HslVU (ClpYQ) peptidase subunit